jgi:hypothetical protein
VKSTIFNEDSAVESQIEYGQVQQKQIQKLLKAAKRPHQDLDGYLITNGGGRHFFVTPDSARFLLERLEPAVEEGRTSSELIEAVMSGGYKAQRGWGVHSGARIFSGMPRSGQSPLPPVHRAWSLATPGPPISLQELTCKRLGSRDSLKRQASSYLSPIDPVNRCDTSSPLVHTLTLAQAPWPP